MNSIIKYVFVASLIISFMIFLFIFTTENYYIFDRDLLNKLASNQSIHDIISEFNCPAFLNNNYTDLDYEIASNWKFSDELFFNRIDSEPDRCGAIKKTFDFNEKVLSKEEEEFPLAYGMIVYRDAIQVYWTLSVFYHPQHLYCIAVDGKSDNSFKQRINELEDCLSNVKVIEHDPINWCESSVLKAQYTCFHQLAMQNHSWHYYQYITSFDLPLKTNLETIRILKNLENAVVTEIAIGGNVSLNGEKHKDSPVKVWKSSMAAVVSRKAVDSLFKIDANYEILKKIVKHLLSTRYVNCVDELFWSSIFGNEKVFKPDGSFNSYELLKANINKWKMSENTSITEEEPYILHDPTIARYQRWNGECKGKYVHSSCAFGIRDLAAIIRRHHLIAHKFYMYVEPVGYFCLWKMIKDKARDLKQSKFKGEYYKVLPQVRLYHGESLKESLKIPSDLRAFTNK